MEPPLVSVVIPTRAHESVEVTMRTLMAQSYTHLEVLTVVDWERRGAPWARNRGAELVRGEYLLFSDSDISWKPDAIALMVTALETPEPRITKDDTGLFRVGYAYGAYAMGGRTFCTEPWTLRVLRGRNLASTMSLMRREVFPGFDETLPRLQDWELWLRLALEHRVCGVQVPEVLFETEIRNGITFDGATTYEQAWATIRTKHGLPVPPPAPPGWTDEPRKAPKP